MTIVPLWLELTQTKTIAAYASTYLSQTYGLSPWLGMFVGGAAAVAVALFMGFMGFRFVILTIAFGEITRLVMSHVEALGSFSGIFLDFRTSRARMQFRGNTPYYYISLGMMLLSVAAERLIETSRLGASWWPSVKTRMPPRRWGSTPFATT